MVRTLRTEVCEPHMGVQQSPRPRPSISSLLLHVLQLFPMLPSAAHPRSAGSRRSTHEALAACRGPLGRGSLNEYVLRCVDQRSSSMMAGRIASRLMVLAGMVAMVATQTMNAPGQVMTSASWGVRLAAARTIVCRKEKPEEKSPGRVAQLLESTYPS
jgi:hypothetical protein